MKVAAHLEHYFEGELVVIDDSLHEVIIKFNELGYETHACCSGLPEDHAPDHDTKFYVSFRGRIPSEYLVLAKSYGFTLDTFRGDWIGHVGEIPKVHDCVRGLIKSWNRQLNKEKSCRKKINASSVNELSLQEATT